MKDIILDNKRHFVINLKLTICQVAAHLMLKGLIDPAKEVEKLNKKKTALQGTVDKLKKAMEVKDYESKVS